MPMMGYGDGTEFTRRSGPRKGEFVKRYRTPDGRWHATSWPKKPSRAAITARIAELSSDSPSPSEGTVAEFVERWLRDGTTNLRGRTVRGYRVLAQGPIDRGLGAVPLASLTTPVIQRWVNDGASAHAFAVLRAALSEAVRWGLIPVNPARGVRLSRPERAEPRILSPEQTRRLLDQVKGDPLEALFVLSVWTGMRQGEALGLRWQDVDLRNGTLTVARSLWWQSTPKGRVPVLTMPKTKRSRRTIGLAPPVIEALREHQRREMLASKDGLVFIRSDGTALEPSTVYRVLHRHLKAAGLPTVRWHDLRHAAASMLLASGMDVASVSELLGHSNAYVTLSIYSHTLEGRRQAVAERMGDLLSTPVHQSVSDEANPAG